MKYGSVEERFWEKVDRRSVDECWPWIGTLANNGYGRIMIAYKLHWATHLALELSGKPRPDGQFALHRCDNPLCVNPSHLWWGTPLENMQDMAAKGRAKLGLSQKKGDDLVAAVLESPKTSKETATDLGVRRSWVDRQRRKHGIAPVKRAKRSHCIRGHSLDGGAVMDRGDGRRECRVCANDLRRARREKDRAT